MRKFFRIFFCANFFKNDVFAKKKFFGQKKVPPLWEGHRGGKLPPMGIPNVEL